MDLREHEEAITRTVEARWIDAVERLHNHQLAVDLFGIAIARVALTQVGVTERPRNSNRGPEVDQYVRDCGRTPGGEWCAYYVQSMRIRAAKLIGDTLREIHGAGSCVPTVAWSGGAVRSYQKNVGSSASVGWKTIASAPYRVPVGTQLCRIREYDAKLRDKAAQGRSAKGHTMIVLTTITLDDGRSAYLTNEGNTSKEGENANGGGVFNKHILVDDVRIVGGVLPCCRVEIGEREQIPEFGRSPLILPRAT